MKQFAVFCKRCGSENVDVYCNIQEEVVFECEDCKEKEIKD